MKKFYFWEFLILKNFNKNLFNKINLFNKFEIKTEKFLKNLLQFFYILFYQHLSKVKNLFILINC